MNKIKGWFYFLIGKIIFWAIVFIVAMLTTFMMSWLLCDKTCLQTVSSAGGWWQFCKLSIGVGIIMWFIKRGEVQLIPVPIPMESTDTQAASK